MKNKLIPAILQPCFQKLQVYLREWIARKPGTALTLVILSSVLVLPLVTSVALTPFIILLNLSNFLATKGVIYVLYMFLFQVITLAVLLAVLFFIAFGFATLLSLLHSYKFLYK
ncbi:uncharacterized protein LOC108912833 [Anoplophora glabripennis]|uniref:uncharacterized protein LOC108912833 n=1 Tax=Anoplophora glabripennis TaxID=217634 RepID=UPI000873CF01|nr:uncharacterized protein LOC108912833 [Anoplophora glabripennis]